MRIRSLTPSQRDRITEKSAKLIGKDGTPVEFRVTEIREGVKSCIYEVTKQSGLIEDGALMAEGIEWVKVDLGMLSDDEGVYSYDKLFTSKDDVILSAIYRRENEATEAEVQAITLKVLPVSAD